MGRGFAAILGSFASRHSSSFASLSFIVATGSNGLRAYHHYQLKQKLKTLSNKL